MEQVFTWNDFFITVSILVLTYWLLVALSNLFKHWSSKNRKSKSVWHLLNTLIIYFFPLVVLVLFVVFIGINPILHSVFSLVVIALGYRHIQHYLNGVLFKTNPLVAEGAKIIVGNHEGYIETFLPFGVILHTANGERYIHYNDIERLGFSVTHKEDGTLRQTIFLAADTNRERVLDLLFDNPMVNFDRKPSVLRLKDSQQLKLQLTLEKAVLLDDVITFLEDNDIVVSTNKIAQTDGDV